MQLTHFLLPYSKGFQMGSLCLPANASILEHNYSVTALAALNTQTNDFFEDDYHQKDSGIAKRQTLYLHSFTMRTNKTDCFDSSLGRSRRDLDIKQRKIYLLKQFFKVKSILNQFAEK